MCDLDSVSPGSKPLATAIFIGVFSVPLFFLIIIIAVNGKKIISAFNDTPQQVPFLFGFSICTSSLGIAFYLADIILYSIWLSNCITHAVIPLKLMILLLFIIVVSLCFILQVVYVGFNRKTIKLINSLLHVSFASITFFVSYFCLSLFPFFLLTFAYPLNALSLLAVLLAYIFVVTVVFAALIAQVIFPNISLLDRRYCSNVKTIVKGSWVMFCIAFLYLLALSIFIAVLYTFTSVFLQAPVTGSGAKAVVPFLPSLMLILIGWLLKLGFFGQKHNTAIEKEDAGGTYLTHNFFSDTYFVKFCCWLH